MALPEGANAVLTALEADTATLQPFLLEMTKRFPAEMNQQLKTEAGLATAFNKLTITQSTKLRKFVTGEKFSCFVQRFKEYVQLTNLGDTNLYLFFLQHVDDETYTRLKQVEIEADKTNDVDEFCREFITAIYGEETVALQSEALACKQLDSESVSTFASRLGEMIKIAFPKQVIAEKNKLLTFVRGLRDDYIKLRLCEEELSNFSTALKLAKRLETAKSYSDKNAPVPILKETPESFRPARDMYSSPEQKRRHNYERRDSRASRFSPERSNRNWSSESRYSDDRYRDRSVRREPPRDRDSSWCAGSSRSRSRSWNGNRKERSRSRSNWSTESRDSDEDYNFNRTRGRCEPSNFRSNRAYSQPMRVDGTKSSWTRVTNRRQQPKRCWECGKDNHIRRFCRSQHGGEQHNISTGQFRNSSSNYKSSKFDDLN